MKPVSNRGRRLSAERIGRAEKAMRARELALEDDVRQAAECQPRAGRHAGTLTKMEALVLEMIGLGMTDAEIAEAAGNSKATAKIHIRRIHDKLAIAGMRRLAVVATRLKAA